MDSPISNTVTLHDPNHGPTHLTPDTPSLWGCIGVGLYQHGAVSWWVSPRHGAKSDYNTLLTRHDVIPAAGEQLVS